MWDSVLAWVSGGAALDAAVMATVRRATADSTNWSRMATARELQPRNPRVLCRMH